MSDIPRIASVPIPCPKCAAETGFPYRAETIPNRSIVELSLRCHECGHEWVALFEGVPNSPRKPIPQHAAHWPHQ